AMAKRVLVVEDEEELGELIAEIMRLRGLAAEVMHHGAPAPAWVRENQTDLVLLDLMLPDRNGYSVCEELKLDRQTNLTPIVMVTACNRHEDMVRGLAVGANE